jgi:hypothetical protein
MERLRHLRDKLRRWSSRRPAEPVLSKDHSLDWTAEDIINPRPRIFMPPELVRLAAVLGDFSRERRDVLAESVSPNGWPAWWARYYDRPGWDWESFKAECLEALDNLHDSQIPVETTLTLIERDREGGFTA